MNNIFLKISAIILSVLVLFSTFSFNVDKHYCGDFLVDISFTGETEGCGMQMDAKAPTKKKNCCKDETHQFEGQDELQLTSFEEITFENQQLLIAFAFSYQDLLLDKKTEKSFQRVYPPPEIQQNYQVIYQSFLI
ncbi:HYC_CC_PP family protein [Polaribacter porphyrae]|uniref:Secreted protein n=1 Tax=Polaribacter porphyrae TaxID=1137780 RepID=A0A2S7WSE8_9FLAO|nr:hypothetical protein [Polaribacter porphyrae]PQJ80518.1 hypothetical protein BTO18_15645 [Polaribacter porphyrae]